ncbi:MAG: aminopeptidase P family protein [Clostridiales bacterium]|nr:aminopeptidase P family protein [Clostridiales bacterium]
MYAARAVKILRLLKEKGISQMLVTDPFAVGYLTGYFTEPHERFLGLLLRENGDHVLFLNKLFFVTVDTGVREVWFSDTDPVMDLVSGYVTPGEVLGIDKYMHARFLLPLMEKSGASGYVLSSECIDEARGVKDSEEIAKMAEASRINDLAMDRLKALLRPGVTELEIADQLKGIYQELGAQDNSFAPIVAFGENAADGHHMPDDTVLSEGQCVIFDVGCLRDGYCSDMTRTFFWRSVSDKHRAIYELVKKAQQAAVEAVRPGRRLCEIDAAARDVIAAEGFGENFNHRLGHFIGMEVHEFGDVSGANRNEAVPGMIFSIEPGIYLPGEMGVRIEDLVLVTEDGCRRLNHYSHEICVVG